MHTKENWFPFSASRCINHVQVKVELMMSIVYVLVAVVIVRCCTVLSNQTFIISCACCYNVVQQLSVLQCYITTQVLCYAVLSADSFAQVTIFRGGYFEFLGRHTQYPLRV